MADLSTILWLEDDPNDAFLFERALGMVGFGGTCHLVANGKEGMDYLCHQGRFIDQTTFLTPDLVVSDLKMPLVAGLEFIRWFRSQPQFDAIPLFVCSGSDLDRDLEEGMKAGADQHYVKPSKSSQWEKTVRDILELAMEVRGQRTSTHVFLRNR